MRFLILPLMSIFFSVGASAQHYDGCPVADVRFPPGSSETVISGMIPAEGHLCFNMNVREGQQVAMTVLEGNNTIFTVYDVRDAQDDLTFAAPSNMVQFLVGQLMRVVEPQQFRLEITVR